MPNKTVNCLSVLQRHLSSMRNFFTALILITASSSIMAQNFAIGHRTITYTDPARSNRAIATEVYYPAATVGDNVNVASGEFPVIVFGHGFTMAYSAYQNWWTEFVPEGYIVMLPKTEGGLIPGPNHAAFGLDLAFLANKMQADNADSQSPFYAKVRPRTAIMGHSMGAGATVLGASNNTSIQCIVTLAAAETNPSAVTAAANVSVPALFLYGTEDQVTPEATNSLAIFNALGSDCKAYARITEGAHCFFADYNVFCATGETSIGTLTREEQHAISFTVVHPWLRYFLWDDCTAYDAFENEISTNPGLGTNIFSCPNDAPVITDNGGTLQSTNATNYQWYLDGEPITNEVAQTHAYSATGTYQVGTVNVGTCEVLSNSIIISPTGVARMGEPFRLSHYRDQMTIHLSNAERNVSLEWTDVSGKLLFRQQLSDRAAGAITNIAIPAYQGIKLLRITTTEHQQVFKVF